MSPSWAVLGACVLLAVPTALAPESAVAGATYLVGLAVVVASLWWGARACGPGRPRTGWRLIAGTATFWLMGDTVARITAALGGSPDDPGVADLFWLGSYPLTVAGVLAFVRGRGLAATVRREIHLDVTVVTAAVMVGTWQLLVQPNLAGSRLDLTAALAVAYPLGDVAIFAMALMLLLAPGGRGAARTLLIGCLGSTLVVDALITGLALIAPQVEAAPLDAALLLVNALLAAAALHPSRGELATPPPADRRPAHLHRWRVLLLGCGLVTVNVAAVLPQDPSLADRVIVMLAAFVVSGTILARFYRVVRERESAEERLFHQAHHDQLTGLANRSLLLERLGAELLAPSHDGSPHPHQPRDLVLVYVDLDGFKAVNDGWGHAAGDEVLRTVAERLTRATRAGDTVARLGGDEFVVLCRDVPPDAAETLGSSLRDVVMRPIDVGAAEPVRVGASVGVYAASGREDAGHAVVDLEDLLSVVDSAMYEAKHRGGGVRRAVPSC